ncbi:MAG: lytic transglycosylase domain-containing protein [Aquificae bacterium]|nr:lytic transglycosylase domain-containing protein [Aquificota bacterium]
MKYFLVFILLLLFSCTPKVKKTVLGERDFVVLKEGNFYLSEEDFRYVQREARKLRIKIPKRKEVERALLFYLKRKEDLRYAFLRMKKYEDLIVPILRKYGLPEELKYLPVIESLYNPFAVSRSGAAGIWQLMPATAKRYGLRISEEIDERFDIIRSTEAAARYLSDLYREFGDWELVLAAYNCGEGCVRRKSRGNFWDSQDNLPRETRNYVPLFMAVLLIATEGEKYGLTRPEGVEKLVALKISFPAEVRTLAEIFGIRETQFRDANPHIRGSSIPPGTYIYLEERFFASRG